MLQEESTQSLEAEIRALEEKLAARKAAEKNTEEIPAREEKEVFRDVLKEHVEHTKETVEKLSEKPVDSADSTPQTSTYDYAQQSKNMSDHLIEREHHEQIKALVELALTKGVLEAITVARHLSNPHLLDDFHDTLVDEYYEKLVQARQIS